MARLGQINRQRIQIKWAVPPLHLCVWEFVFQCITSAMSTNLSQSYHQQNICCTQLMHTFIAERPHHNVVHATETSEEIIVITLLRILCPTSPQRC